MPSSPSLTDLVTEDVVKPVARDISRDPVPHVLGLVGAVAVIALLTLAFGALMGGAGVVVGLFLGLSCIGGLGVVAYATGAKGLADLLRRTRAAV